MKRIFKKRSFKFALLTVGIFFCCSLCNDSVNTLAWPGLNHAYMNYKLPAFSDSIQIPNFAY